MQEDDKAVLEWLDDYDSWAKTPEASESAFVVHVSGPDDVLPARTWLEAFELACGLNRNVLEAMGIYGNATGTRIWASPSSRGDATENGLI